MADPKSAFAELKKTSENANRKINSGFRCDRASNGGWVIWHKQDPDHFGSIMLGAFSDTDAMIDYLRDQIKREDAEDESAATGGEDNG